MKKIILRQICPRGPTGAVPIDWIDQKRGKVIPHIDRQVWVPDEEYEVILGKKKDESNQG